MTSTIRYGASGPTERELRLLGDVKAKRVLVLGSGDGQAAAALAAQGAVTIGVEPSEDRLAAARAHAEEAEAHVEWRHGDLADLAFLRADSIDLAVSIGTVVEVEDLARLFRQVQRVLRPSTPFVFSYPHPFAACLGGDGRVVRSYLGDSPGATPEVPTVSSVFTELHRAGFRVDVVAEPAPSDGGRLPVTIVWRARKEGS